MGPKEIKTKSQVAHIENVAEAIDDEFGPPENIDNSCSKIIEISSKQVDLKVENNENEIVELRTPNPVEEKVRNKKKEKTSTYVNMIRERDLLREFLKRTTLN